MIVFLFIPLFLFLSYLEKIEVLIMMLPLLLAALIFSRKNKLLFKEVLLLFFITVFLILAIKESHLSFSFDKEGIVSFSGTIIEDSQIAKFEQRRIKIKLNSANIQNGDASSANGVISIYGKTKRLYSGDKVKIYGNFVDNEFKTKTILLQNRSRITKFRVIILEKIEKRIQSLYSKNVSNLMLMLILGFSNIEGFELKEKAASSGSSFVLALSGMHLSIYYLVFSLILFPFKKETKKPFIMIFLFLFVFLIGNKASLIRAIIFRFLFLVFKKWKGSEILSLTLLIHLILFPLSALSLSSLYSYSALTGILFISPSFDYFKKNFHPVLSYLFTSLTLTLSALCFSSHISLLIFSSFQISILLTASVLTLFISIFLVLSLISLFIRLPYPLMKFFYDAIKGVMELGSRFSTSKSLFTYFLLLFVLLVIFLFSMLKQDVEPKLR